MSATFDRQVRILTGAGSDLAADGEGMHSRFAMDWPTDLNNIWGYTQQRLVSCRGQDGDSTTDLAHFVTVTAPASAEVFAAQVPIVVPAGMARLAWTFGLRIWGGAGGGTVSAATLYMTTRRYAGAGPVLAFEPTRLSPDYKSRSIGLGETAAASTYSNYLAVDDVSTGIVAPYPRRANLFETDDDGAYLVLTLTGTGDDGIEGGGWYEVHDFTAWFLPE